mgnify:CR=1 FL=1
MNSKFFPLGALLCFGVAAFLPAFSGAQDDDVRLNVLDFGAVGEGETVDSPALQRAIDACAEQGGGEVRVPAGDYLCGTVLLKDGVTLHLAAGATLLGSEDLADYANPDFFVDATGQERGWCLIGIIDAEDVAIVGEGTIDGRGEGFRGQRPFLVRCVRSEGVRLEGIHLRNSAAWVCHLFQSREVTIRGIEIYSHANANNDGIDIDSTADVLIEDCDIDTGDDAVCIKATSPVPTENVVVRNCRLKSDWGAFKLGTESMGDFRNIRFVDSTIHDTNGGAIKILSMDGCRLENLVIDSITVTNSDMPLFMRLGERLNAYREPEARTPGHLRNVQISNLIIDTSPEGRLMAPTAIVITGERTADTTHFIENVRITDVTINLEGGGRIEDVGQVVERTRRNNYPEYIFFFEPDAPRLFPAYGIYARHVRGLSFDDVRIETRQPDSRPLAFLENAHEVRLGVRTNSGNGPQLVERNSTAIVQSEQ